MKNATGKFPLRFLCKQFVGTKIKNFIEYTAGPGDLMPHPDGNEKIFNFRFVTANHKIVGEGLAPPVKKPPLQR